MKILLPLLLCSIGGVVAAITPCTSAAEAKAVAESETMGEAVSAHRDQHHHRAGFAPWVVRVHMPGQDQGWRCIIAWDTGKLLEKKAIPNPPSKLR